MPAAKAAESLRHEAEASAFSLAADNRRLVKVREDIAAHRERISTYRKRLRKGISLSDNNWYVGRFRSTIENRLCAAKRKQMLQLKVNKDVIAGVNELRREKLMQKAAYQNLKAKLVHTKRNLARVQQKINSDQQGISDIEDQTEKILQSREEMSTQFGELVLEQKKGVRRVDGARENNKFATDVGQLSFQSEKNLKSSANSDDWVTTQKRMKTTEIQSQMEKLADQFDCIQKTVGTNSLQELVARYHEVRDHNYSRLQQSHALSEERRGLERQLQEVREELHNFQNQFSLDFSSKASRLAMLQKQFKETQKTAAAYEEKNATAAADKLALQALVQGMWRAVVSDSTVDSEEGVAFTKPTMIQQLGMVEERLRELLIEAGLGQSSTDSSLGPQHPFKCDQKERELRIDPPEVNSAQALAPAACHWRLNGE
jgi:hypothetical protein